jgi:hypothetical protein
MVEKVSMTAVNPIPLSPVATSDRSSLVTLVEISRLLPPESGELSIVALLEI